MTVETGTDGLIRESWERIIIAEDLELHVSVISTEDSDIPDALGGMVFAEIRNFIPSTSTYGRGVLLPTGTARMVSDALRAMLREEVIS